MKIENIKACVFDAYGTLFDVNSAAAKCKEKLGSRWEGFANAWRTTQLEYTWLRSLMKKHKNFWEITEDSLDHTMETFKIKKEMRNELLNLYKELGKKYGPIDLTFINIGAYNFYPMAPKKDKSIFHTNPEEALNIGQDLKSKKVIGMHWGTVVLSLEPIMEPPVRFKTNAEKYGYKKEDAILFKIGEVQKLEDLL